MDSIVDRIIGPVTAFLTPQSDLHWPYFILTAFIGLALYVMRRAGPLTPRDFLSWLCPPEIHGHRSAKLDWAIFAINTVFFAGSTFGVAAMVAVVTRSALTIIFGQPDAIFPTGLATDAAFTIGLIVAGDLAMFLAHYWLHKSPLMWEFHKVHHSAAVLMPITAYRQHPVEELITGALNGIAIGIVGGAFLYGSSPDLQVISISGHNAVEFAFIVAARHLRHSHIPLSWGTTLEHVVISPEQHRIHHSVDARHRDKNLGQIFAFWDWMFGTLYICKPDPEPIVYGIDGRTEYEFTSLIAIYVGPFRAAAKRIVDR